MAVLSRLALKKVEEHDHLENVFISRAGARSAAWGRSWAALGAYVGGLGPLLGPMFAILGAILAVLGHLGAGEVGLGPKWSVLRGDQGREVAQTRAGRPFWGGNRFSTFFPRFRSPAPPVDFFL